MVLATTRRLLHTKSDELLTKPPADCVNYKNRPTMTNDKEEQTKKMMSEEYGRSLTGCFTAFVVVVLALIGIGVLVCITTI